MPEGLSGRAGSPLRALFLALVMVNLLLYSWQAYSPSARSASTLSNAGPTIQLGGERLVLLSELPQTAAIAPTEVRETDLGVDSEAASVPPEEALPAPSPSVATSPATRDRGVESPPAQHRCYALGPFAGVQDAEAATQRLSAHASSAPAVRQVAAQEQIGFWVLLPPLESREAAVEKVRELRRRGIDSFVVTRGGPPNSISLGVFGQRSAADTHAQQLRRKGIASVVEPRLRTRVQYWLDFDGTDAEHLRQDALTELLAKQAGIAWSGAPCK